MLPCFHGGQDKPFQKGEGITKVNDEITHIWVNFFAVFLEWILHYIMSQSLVWIFFRFLLYVVTPLHPATALWPASTTPPRLRPRPHQLLLLGHASLPPQQCLRSKRCLCFIWNGTSGSIAKPKGGMVLFRGDSPVSWWVMNRRPSFLISSSSKDITMALIRMSSSCSCSAASLSFSLLPRAENVTWFKE